MTLKEIQLKFHNGEQIQTQKYYEGANIPSKLGLWNGRLYSIREKGDGSFLDDLWVKIQNFVASILESYKWMTFDRAVINPFIEKETEYFEETYSAGLHKVVEDLKINDFVTKAEKTLTLYRALVDRGDIIPLLEPDD